MKKTIFLLAIIFATSIACNKVPITGRKQLNILPESTMLGLSLTSYSEVMSASKVLNNSDAQLIKNVGAKMAAATEKFLRDNKLESRIKDFKWEFNLIDDKQVNAWCMPGGKVAFYTGILPITKNENGIAVVMSHEIAHAVARHGNERMSQGLLTQAGGMALEVFMSEKPEQTKNMFRTAYGVGANVGVILPFSRAHESEADKMGLVIMAIAGYRPDEAVGFWQRMAAAKGPGNSPPEMLSTHPSDETRIKNIRAYLPTAMKYYKGN